MIRIGIDCGVTFTDIVIVEDQKVSVHKIPSSPSDPAQSVLNGLQKFIKQGQEYLLRYGPALPSALNPGKDVKCILITNEGFEDLLEIGKETRSDTYNLDPDPVIPLIDASNRIGIKERRAADGKPLLSLDQKELDRIKALVKKAKPDSIAVALLHSYANPESELQIRDCLQDLEIPLFMSHQVLPEFRELERFYATVLNARIHPEMNSWFSAIQKNDKAPVTTLEIMQSNGGVTTADIASEEPVRTLSAGTAAGVVGAFNAGRQAGHKRIAAFEVGGTSAGISLCEGDIPVSRDMAVAQYPVALQAVEIKKTGPGTGACVRVDDEGLLRVGPQSAGNDPGPICYGKGEQVTLCDAHVLLNRIDPDNFLGGEMIIQTDKIHDAFTRLADEMKEKGGTKPSNEELAEGIIRIENARMAKEIRNFAQDKGCGTADMTMVAYGGAGPLHACEIARALDIKRIVIPPDPGVLSAMGMLEADLIEDLSRTVLLSSEIPRVSSAIVKNFREMKDIVREKLKDETPEPRKIEFEEFVDIRYPGQSSEIRIPYSRNFIQAFHKEHNFLYGHSDSSIPVEIVTVRVRGRILNPVAEMPKQKMKSKTPPGKALIQERSLYFAGEQLPTPYFLRNLLCPGNKITGPAIVLEYSSTTLIPQEFEGLIDPWNNLVIEKAAKK